MDKDGWIWMDGDYGCLKNREKNLSCVLLHSYSKVGMARKKKTIEEDMQTDNKGDLENRRRADLSDGEGACLSPNLYQLLLSKPVVLQ